MAKKGLAEAVLSKNLQEVKESARRALQEAGTACVQDSAMNVPICDDKVRS